MDDELDRPQFSVAMFFKNGTHLYIARLVTGEAAAIVFQHCVAAAERERGAPRARVERIIITDGGDCTAREWTRGKGITIPNLLCPHGYPLTVRCEACRRVKSSEN